MEVRSKSKNAKKNQKNNIQLEIEKPHTGKSKNKTQNTKINDFFNFGETKSSTNQNNKNTEKSNLPASSGKKGKKDIPFISKANIDKLDNPKYKISNKEKQAEEENKKESSDKIKYAKILEFDAEARKNKEKNKFEELNKNKIRKNLKLPTSEEEINISIVDNNTKKTGRGSKNSKKEINFISQSEIENKQKLEKQQDEKEKDKDKEKANKKEENLNNNKVQNEEKENNKNPKKGRGAKSKKNQSENEIKNDNKQIKNENEELELNEKSENKKEQENIATNRKLDLSDENVEKITPLLVDENENNSGKDMTKFTQILEESEKNKENIKPKKVPKEKKPPAPKKPLKEIKPPLEGDYDMIINFEDILKKDKYENSDLLLLIFEICQNAIKYNLKKSNKSKLFWDEVFLKAEFAQIFKQFKSETLRKYWRVVTETQNVKAFLEIIQKYAEKINNPNIKLLTIINAIADTIKGKLSSFDDYLKNLSEINNFRENFFSSYHAENNQNFLNRKTKRTDEDREINEQEKKKENIFDMNIDEVKKDLEGSNYKEKSFTPKKEMGSEKVFYSTPRKSLPDNLFFFNKNDSKYHQKLESQKLKKIVTVSDNDRNLFNSIDEIVNEFSKNFPQYSNEQILDSLKNNSFNLENTYFLLTNPREFEGLSFTDADDYILINMKNTEYYNQLVSIKGKENVEKRRLFLNLDDQYVSDKKINNLSLI